MLGQSIHNYGEKCTNPEARAILIAMKPKLETVGRLHRNFVDDIELKVIDPLENWIQVEIKRICVIVHHLF